MYVRPVEISRDSPDASHMYEYGGYRYKRVSVRVSASVRY